MTTKSVARKHHYLPQSYLAAFTTSGTKEGQLFALDVKKKRTFHTSPTNVAAERDFNRIDIDGHSQDAIENALAPFEGEAVSAIRRVIESHRFPPDSDWNLILNLLALIAVRNPHFRNSFNSAREQSLRIAGDMLASDERLWSSHFRKARETDEKIPNVSFEEFKSFINKGEYEFIFHPQENLRVEFNALDKILPIFGQRTWSVLVAPPEGPEFICSDHPVTLAPRTGQAGSIGFATHNTEVFFPLGRQVGFYGVFESPLKPVVYCKPLSVGIMNARVMNNAERHVYSAQKHFSVYYSGEIHNICNDV